MESQKPSESSSLEQTLPVTYKEKVSTLPRRRGWVGDSELYEYQGFWGPPLFIEGAMICQDHFQAQPTDIILCSAPKTGTTWLKALAFAILTRHRFDGSNTPLLTAVSHDCVPFLELDAAQDSFARSPLLFRPLLATHLPYASLPKSMLSSHCKILYIGREPKDVFVSLWHSLCKLAPREGEHLALEEAVDMFCKGISLYGPYWDHVLGYWKASLDCPEKVLFLNYEDLKSDTLYYLKVLAQFMGCPFSLEEEIEGVMQKVADLCSFQSLSNLTVNKTGKHRPNTPLEIENNVYFRKGNVGGWKNCLTEDMVRRMDGISEHKFSGSGLTFLRPP